MTHRRVGNPLAATVVSVVIAGAGVWLVGAAQSTTGVVFGVLFAVAGVLAALGTSTSGSVTAMTPSAADPPAARR